MFLTHFFQKIRGANIENNTNDAQKTLEQMKLEKDEQILSLDAKKFIHQRSRKGSHEHYPGIAFC